MLLADVFKKFIDTHLKFYGLDACHYFSSPGLSWDAMLKMTGVELEKISDIDNYVFIEKGLKGENSYIAKRYAKANNKYMKDHDPRKPSKFITYLDMNNLYGWAMSEYLPYEGFKWLKNSDGFDVNSIREKSPIGYILNVNLKCPDELHESHSDYQLASEKLAIPYDMLLYYCKKLADKYRIKVGDVKKLIPNLGNKTNYLLHYRDLQLYLSLGMKLTKIHRVLDLSNLTGRKKILILTPKKEKMLLIILKKNFFNLMINSVYGKTMEKLRKRINVRLVTSKKRFLKNY